MQIQTDSENYYANRPTFLFPLCLVLYEFSTYVGNDMIQPGMLAVIKQYNAGIQWIPTSMTAYLSGSMILQWLLGPLSDRIGRRPIMLSGVAWFIFTCLSVFLVQNIEQFTFLRFLQGISLCFIGTVGYAAIQESFEESVCIKITALMANVSLIAPMLGPLMGAAWIQVASWKGMFVLFALLATVSFIGLYFFMPETTKKSNKNLSIKILIRDYFFLLKNIQFVIGSLALGFISLPLLTWISQSPIIMIDSERFSVYKYGLLQIPIFSALISGNILLANLTSRYSTKSLVISGSFPIIIGLLFSTISVTFFPEYSWILMIAGLSIYAFGIGLSNAGLVRLTLFSSKISKGTVSAAMGILQMLIFTIGIEISKHTWIYGGNSLFSFFNLVNGVLWLGFVVIFTRKNIQK